jgi:hypothetical protein
MGILLPSFISNKKIEVEKIDDPSENQAEEHRQIVGKLEDDTHDD